MIDSSKEEQCKKRQQQEEQTFRPMQKRYKTENARSKLNIVKTNMN
jgi:hypothetical protein